MPFTDAELRELVRRASTLDERVRRGDPGGEPPGGDEVDALLLRWRQRAAGDDEASFDRRLAWDGLDRVSARRALATPGPGPDEPLPPWAATLRLVLGGAGVEPLQAPAAAPADRAVDPGEILPFEEIVLPFVAYARRCVPADRQARIAVSALASLERALLRRLARLFMRPLYTDFVAYRATRQSGFSRLFAPEGSDGVYRAFAERMRAGGLAALCFELPVLARAAAQVTDRWIETTIEFLDRVAADRLAIAETFGGGEDEGDLVALETELADPHHGGRTVAIARFASGLRVVYKSRPVGIEQAYFGLLAWLNGEGLAPPLRVLRVLERPGYGWLEFVEPHPCADADEADRYFHRAGMLLCLVHALGGDDCHGENVIAAGEHPVLVDLETIIRPLPSTSSPAAADALDLARLQFQDGVLGTGFLPRWETDGESGSIDVSGLGGELEQTSIDRFPRWSHTNTDRMALEEAFGKVAPAGNVVHLAGAPLAAAAYADALVGGFRAMYGVLLRKRDAILAGDGALRAFAHQVVRFVFRSTHVYARALDASLHPSVLHDGAARSVEIDVLSREFLLEPALYPFSELCRAERNALESLDIPHFPLRADSVSLSLGAGRWLDGFFGEAPFPRAVARLRRLGDGDLSTQVALIRAALRSSQAVEAGDAGADDALDDDAPLTPQELLSAARAIAEELSAAAIRSANGGASWIGLGYLPLAGRFQLQPLGYDLYGGVTGIALFLAACEGVAGETTRELAYGALLALRRDLSNGGGELARGIGIGAATGLGSLVYGLVRTARMLRDDSLLEDATRAAGLITPDHIAGDAALDVVSGAAGALLGLLALYDASPQPWVLARAVDCGEHLLRSRVEIPGRGRAWQTIPGEPPMTGFSHGAAGIAYALLRLSKAAGEPAFRAAALEGIGYERSHFDPAAGNWPDVRAPAGKDGPGVHRTAWCHGAPGVAIARLGGLGLADTPEVRADAEAGLETTRRFGAGALDDLCCGGAGRIEALIEGARRLRRPELLATAHRQAGRMVRRSLRLGGYQTQGSTGQFSPGLFQGIAGVGYTLLRLYDPDRLPSVLLWE
jgi:type 2 lantibiotic biosynthesis protein LanM